MHFLSFYTIKIIDVTDGLTVWRHFPEAMQYYLVPCALQRHVRQTMQYVVLLTRVDMHLGQSEYVYL